MIEYAPQAIDGLINRAVATLCGLATSPHKNFAAFYLPRIELDKKALILHLLGMNNDFSEEFWHHVIKSSFCWEWDNPSTAGYGAFKRMTSHRYMWIHILGRDAPEGMVLHHKCENKACLRPEHLELLDPDDHRDRHYPIGKRYVHKPKTRRSVGKTIEEYFLSMIDKLPNGCWEYLSNNQYYPVIHELGRESHKKMYAHRFMWIRILKREAPKGYELHHTCDNTHCVNPDHLELLTKGEHSAFRWNKYHLERESRIKDLTTIRDLR